MHVPSALGPAASTVAERRAWIFFFLICAPPIRFRPFPASRFSLCPPLLAPYHTLPIHACLPRPSHPQNLEITQAAEDTYNLLAKANKTVGANKEKNLPWFVILEIKGESIDVAHRFPDASAARLDVDSKSFTDKVWDPLVDVLTTNYAKSACYVAVDVIYSNTEGNEVSQPVFFKWCPDSGVPVKIKMMIGSSFQAAKKRLDANGVTPELSQADQLRFKQFAAEAKLKNFA